MIIIIYYKMDSRSKVSRSLPLTPPPTLISSEFNQCYDEFLARFNVLLFVLIT